MKKKFVLRLDEDIYANLEKWAADEFRSVNGQIEWILNHQLKLSGRFKAVKNNNTTEEESGEAE
jgi:hypothetical protein